MPNPSLTYKNYTSFSCTGPACPDNCCNAKSWLIDFDKTSMKKYLALRSDLSDKIKASTKKNKEGTYVVVRKDYCPFLLNDGLCEIHRDLGEGYLSRTCSTYPRQTVKFDGRNELSLDLTCPVVVEKVLFDKNIIEFVEIDRNPIDYTPSQKEMAEFEIRLSLIKILSLEQLSLYEKLVFATLMIRALDKIPKDKNYKDAVFETLDLYERNVTDKQLLKEAIERISAVNEDYKNNVFKSSISFLKSIIVNDKSQKAKNQDFYKKLLEFYSLDMEQYYKLRNELWMPYIKENETVFINYLIHEIFRHQYPKNEETLEKGFLWILVSFFMLQVFTMGVCAKDDKITHNDMINCIYYFQRKTGHTKSIKTMLEPNKKDVTQININTIEALAFLA